MKGLSILAGVVLGVCITLCMGQVSENAAEVKPEPVKVEAADEVVGKPDLDGQNGRYEISAGPVTGVFIVDTQTGHVWRCLREGDKPVWYDYGDPAIADESK